MLWHRGFSIGFIYFNAEQYLAFEFLPEILTLRELKLVSLATVYSVTYFCHWENKNDSGQVK